MKKCLILVAHNKDDDLYIREMQHIVKDEGFSVDVSDTHEAIDGSYDLVFCQSYRKIIPKGYISKAPKGIYVFHSSDLPEGKGWAPIYHSIVSPRKDHVVTMLKIDETADGGDIIAKAYFKKRAGEDADSLRNIDRVMTVKMIEKVAEDLLAGRIKGAKQTGKGSHYPRRKPEDNEVKESQTLKDILPHALAVTDGHPAYFLHEKVKYTVKIRAVDLPPFDEKDIRIKTFYETDSA